ncbi:MAG: hypothetical protein RPU90_04050 [Candidatus Sedimenticola sp. (ex Thyasira tokunagai)]
MNQKFLMSEGGLGKYCHDHKIDIKSFDSADRLSAAIATEYKHEEKDIAGILWFVRQETKPKDTLRHLRNCFAHGNFRKRQKNRTQCIVIENIDKGRVKAKGFLPIEKINGLVRAASSCGV